MLNWNWIAKFVSFRPLYNSFMYFLGSVFAIFLLKQLAFKTQNWLGIFVKWGIFTPNYTAKYYNFRKNSQTLFDRIYVLI